MFTLTIQTDNAAFADTYVDDGYGDEASFPGIELARILHELANTVEELPSGSSGNVRDINGNTVGEWELS